jgi:hypothetical protein
MSKKKRIRELRRTVAQLQAARARTDALLRDLDRELTVVLGSKIAPQASGLWGTAPELFWFAENSITAQVMPAWVLLNGHVAHSAHPEMDRWQLVSLMELEALVGPARAQRFRERPTDALPNVPCPEIRFPLGTYERLDALRARVRGKS